MKSAIGAALPPLDLDDPRLAKLLADIVDARVDAAIKKRVPEIRVGAVDSLLADGDVIVRAHGLGSDGTPMPFLGTTPTVNDKVRAYKWPVGKGAPLFFAEPMATFETTVDLPVLYVKNFGAVADNETDDSDAWQNAINAAIATGGATIYGIPGGKHLLSKRLLVNGSGVVIDLQGGMLRMSPSSTASEVINIQTTDGVLDLTRRCVLMNGTIHANSVCTYGVHLKSVDQCGLRNLFIKGGTVWQVLMDCFDTRPVGGDPRGTQMNWLLDLYLIASGTAGGLQVSGNPTALDADTSLNRFENIHATIDDGDAFSFGNSDGNVGIQLRVYQTPAGVANTTTISANGTTLTVPVGRGLVLSGHATSNNARCRHNSFYQVQVADAGVHALGGTFPSGQNVIYGYSTGNGSPQPYIYSGALLSWYNDDGSSSVLGTQTVNGELLIKSGRLTLNTGLAATLGANQNNWTPAGWGVTISRLAITSSGAFSITGLDATNASTGDVVIVQNVLASTGTVTLTQNDALSTGTNRFVGRSAANVVLAIGGAVMLVYSGSRWMIVGA